MTERDDDDRGSTSENLTRKILTLGLGAYFLTEDTVRRYVKDAKLPRDVARGIVQNATKGKDELYGFVARELSGFLKQMDLQAELDRFMSTHKVRISAEIEFLPRSSSSTEAEPAPGGSASTTDTPPGGTKAAPGKEPGAGPEIEWNVSVKRPPGEQRRPSGMGPTDEPD
jgi:hypothetical protein